MPADASNARYRRNSSSRRAAEEEHTVGKSSSFSRLAQWAVLSIALGLCVASSSSSSSSSSSNGLIRTAEAREGFRKAPFHCYRPFDSLASFSFASMKAKDNCRLDYQQILDAAVSVDCYKNGRRYAHAVSGSEAVDGTLADRFGRLPTASGLPFANGGSDGADAEKPKPPADDRNGCYATMLFKASRDEGYGGRGPAAKDSARYAVKLHTKGGGVVHYKGMDGIGYSACCMLLAQPNNTRCGWRAVTAAPQPTIAVGGGADVDPDSAAVVGDDDASHQQQRLEQFVEYCALEGTHKGDADAVVGSNAKEEAAEEDPDPLGLLEGLDLGDGAQQQKADGVANKDGTDAAASVDDADDSYVGYVTKPLHQQMAGAWTMELLFFRGHDAVGKIVGDFVVTDDMLSPLSRKRHADTQQEDGEGEDGAVIAPLGGGDANADAAAGEALVADGPAAATDASNEAAVAVAVVPAPDGEGAVGGRHRGREHKLQRNERRRHRNSDPAAAPEAPAEGVDLAEN